jgi:thiamine biosynthesis protein ThiS
LLLAVNYSKIASLPNGKGWAGMQITINGKPKDCDDGKSLDTLIGQMCGDNRHVFAELNGQIVRRADWEATVLHPGDQLELVTLVGGG